MELKDLIGLRTLSGVSNSNEPLDTGWGDNETYDAQTFTFILDGITYTACEDNNDGYRSCMGELFVDKFKCSNVFEPIQVLCIYKEKADSGYDTADLLLIYGMNGKQIIEVGTNNADDYYPSFVSYFQPENIR